MVNTIDITVQADLATTATSPVLSRYGTLGVILACLGVMAIAGSAGLFAAARPMRSTCRGPAMPW